MPVFYSFGTTSVMFEVAWCVFLYTIVLALEFLPPVFEWLNWRKAREWAVRLTIVLTVFGVCLSTLHQSSLGALFLMAPAKIHPLWYSPFIPIYFFVSAVIAGLTMVIFESALSHKVFSAQIDPAEHETFDRITLGLGKAASVVLFAYFFLKLQGLADGGSWALLLTPYGYWFLFETLGFILLPSFLFAFAVRRASTKMVRITAAWTVLGVVVNRLNISIVAMNWNVADSPGKVVFSHQTHVDQSKPDCTTCHPKLFKMLKPGSTADGTPIVHAKMEKGRQCGACHNGKDAHGFDDCTTCHRQQ